MPRSRLYLLVRADELGGWTIEGLKTQPVQHFKTLRAAISAGKGHDRGDGVALLILDQQSSPNPPYLLRPPGVRELLWAMSRVLAVADTHRDARMHYRAEGFEVDVVRQLVEVDGHTVRLTPKEFALLSILVNHAGEVVRHELIAETIWGRAHVTNRQYLRVLIGELRRKLGSGERAGGLIRSERGVGYSIAPTDRER